MRRGVNTRARGGASEGPPQQALRRAPANTVQRYAEKTLQYSAQTGAVRPSESLDATHWNVNLLGRTAIGNLLVHTERSKRRFDWIAAKRIFAMGSEILLPKVFIRRALPNDRSMPPIHHPAS